ncbi:preprotein translocase subunit SecE [Slackia heliotrinireducens]|jgi:preprotein translocase subunit SecE|uniref:Protein translocase subunit SecE n=1 Tax=Slackia heliotrinireducens (strain ATCC 29202 / DSM 20476 / NCTC 11029 / RHS 1) TaxID=471855 RepID=C7N4T0_SLAHD|nr:preprotein translocase subunit SecE [Slackia heliotrinireducens]ACV21915.1 preprotein translocase, SecE subunit [Slackia heliotrinireducens DSM 20476]VEG99728.1 preprotein translocase subunit SecE [Slackia heliotrinireducens]
MAKKSKTQRAKHSAARQARKAEAALQVTDEGAASEDSAKAKAAIEKKSDKKAEAKKAETKKPKKERFKFLKDVSAEMKRVTWPSRPEVIRWSGVVVGALLFFGVFVAVLDNLIVTPLIVALSNLGA